MIGDYLRRSQMVKNHLKYVIVFYIATSVVGENFKHIYLLGTKKNLLHACLCTK